MLMKLKLGAKGGERSFNLTLVSILAVYANTLNLRCFFIDTEAFLR